MPITKSALDTILIARVGAMMGVVGFDNTTTNGSNVNTIEPARIGLASLSIASASYTAVVDSDLAKVADTDTPQLIDVAEWALRTACLDAFLDTDTQVDRDAQKADQLAKRWETRIAILFAQLKSNYGYGASTLIAGTINLGFAESNDSSNPSMFD